MKALPLSLCLLAVLMTSLANGSPAAAGVGDDDGWSQEVGGLQARLVLIEKSKLYGTRWLVPYLELRNVRDLGSQMEVNLDSHHLNVELMGAGGESIRSGWVAAGGSQREGLSRTGPAPELSTVILPWDSSIRISSENRNWGIPKDQAAVVSTDSGAWVIQEKERGTVFLRATLMGVSSNPPWKSWGGTLQTPLIKIDWK